MAIDPIDISSKQDTLNKRVASIYATKTDIMEICLFHLLKASNVPSAYINCTIDWIKTHEDNIIQNGSSRQMQREK